ncbi:MAG TPA: cell wall protein [Chloroflexota bacterium]|nr:cell wall protein [Chloroflexota bacterium]
MSQVNRREFLTRTVLSGAGVVSAASLGQLVAPAVDAASPVPGEAEQGGRNPNFAEGKIIGINGSVLTAQSSQLLVQRIQITNSTRIWKVRDTTLDNVQVNDRFYARGVPGSDGTFIAETIWVNIVNIHTVLASVASDRLILNQAHLHQTGDQLIGHIVPETVVIRNLAPPTHDLSQLKVGSHLQIIGAWHPDTNEIDVVKIFSAV